MFRASGLDIVYYFFCLELDFKGGDFAQYRFQTYQYELPDSKNCLEKAKIV